MIKIKLMNKQSKEKKSGNHVYLKKSKKSLWKWGKKILDN